MSIDAKPCQSEAEWISAMRSKTNAMRSKTSLMRSQTESLLKEASEISRQSDEIARQNNALYASLASGIRDAASTPLPPTTVASATLRSAAHTINPGWTAADCIAHLLMLAEIEDMR